MSKAKTIPIKLSVIKVLYDAGMPAYTRLNALLEDVVEGNCMLSEVDKSALLESTAAATNLKILFEEYMSQAEENQVDTLHFPREEYAVILKLAKTVEVSHRIAFGQAGIWAH